MSSKMYMCTIHVYVENMSYKKFRLNRSGEIFIYDLIFVGYLFHI